MFSRNEIEAKIKTSLISLLEYDFKLLNIDAHEHSISHKLAVYLQDEFQEYDVDCEYNRLKEETKKIDTEKQLKEFFEEIRKINPVDINPTFVYPDIIVHKRCKENNILVIEIKKTTSNYNKDNDDFLKLKKYEDQLNYKHAVFLKLKTNTDFNKDSYCNPSNMNEIIEELEINRDWDELIDDYK